MPVEDDPDALRAMLWYYTDQKYKRAVEQLIAVKTNVKVKAEETDKSGDFSPAKAETYDEADSAPVVFDRAKWEEKVRKYTLSVSALRQHVLGQRHPFRGTRDAVVCIERRRCDSHG